MQFEQYDRNIQETPDLARITGQHLGNYYLVRLLGHGGFANVYLGEHIYLKTQAAIKVLQVQLGDGEQVRFLNEARMIAHLVHPHIIRVLDFGVQRSIPFLVMDYAPNGTLRQRHPAGTRLPLSTIVPYVEQVASALQYAHDHQFIHRDVKPGNMLVGARDEILLSDFGTALIAHHTDSQSTQDTVGTIAYMAPEQIEGKPRPATDQYALGIVVYEWLTGYPPFRGSLTEIIAQHMGATPPPLHERFPDISPDVEEAVKIALAKDPYQRFETIQAFAHALEQAYKAQERTAASTLSTTVTPSEPTRREPLPPLVLPASVAPTIPSLPRPAPERASAPQHTQPDGSDGFNGRQTLQQQAIERQSGNSAAQANVGKQKKNSSLRQFIAMLIGIALYGSVYYVIAMLFLQHKDVASSVIFGLSVVIPLFFGVVFGPLVGLATGIGGLVLGHALNSSYPAWNDAIGIGLTGLIAGLAMFNKRGQHRRFRAFATALSYAVPAVILGEGFVDCTSIWAQRIGVASASINFLLYSLLELAGALILLPLALALYATITHFRPR